jgi:hypothetical protein
MDNISIFEGDALLDLFVGLHAGPVPEGVHTVRIHQRVDGVSVKVNGGMWTRTLGKREVS